MEEYFVKEFYQDLDDDEIRRRFPGQKDIRYQADADKEPVNEAQQRRDQRAEEEYWRYWNDTFGWAEGVRDGVADFIGGAMQVAPGTGDAYQFGQAGKSLLEGDLSDAAKYGAFFLLPNFIEQPIRGIRAYNRSRNFRKGLRDQSKYLNPSKVDKFKQQAYDIFNKKFVNPVTGKPIPKYTPKNVVTGALGKGTVPARLGPTALKTYGALQILDWGLKGYFDEDLGYEEAFMPSLENEVVVIPILLKEFLFCCC